MHAFRCARRCASALPKPSSGIHRGIPSTNLAAAGQSLQSICRRPYSSDPTEGSKSVSNNGTLVREIGSNSGTPVREIGSVGKIEEWYGLRRDKDMTPSDQNMTDKVTEFNRERLKGATGPPKLRFTDIKTGMKYHAGRSLVTGEEAKELYAGFKPYVGIVKPGPTDLPGAPTQVHILYRETTSPPERIIESIRRLCYNPSYIVTKEFGPHTVKSTDLLNVELGYSSHFLPNELKPMVMVHKAWRIAKGGRAIEKIFRFDNRDSAREFANGLQRLIKIKITKTSLVEHHPSFGIYGRRVFVRWGTEQPEAAISSWDIACAKQTDRWAGSCNVKDLLPEILDWKFETKFVDRSFQEPKSKSEPKPNPDPVTDASDNLMNIIEGLMSTTKNLMQAAEEPSTVQNALEEASAALSETIERIKKETEENKVLQEAREVEVLKWLDSEDGDGEAETQVEAEGVKEAVEEAVDALGSKPAEAVVDTKAEIGEPETEIEVEVAAEAESQSPSPQTEVVEPVPIEEAEGQPKEALAHSETPKDDKSSQ
ncbi:hypothetical protein TWF281_006455 [Arthrobotrys megalospora]